MHVHTHMHILPPLEKQTSFSMPRMNQFMINHVPKSATMIKDGKERMTLKDGYSSAGC